MSKPCVFFDRDGVVNVYPGEGKYVETFADFILQPEFFDALDVVTSKGYEAVIITNQRGVTLGKTKEEDLKAMHDHVLAHAAERGLHIRDILFCTDDDNNSPRRKPNPGMLLEAAEKYDLDLSRSWMIGDDERDVIAGRRAGCTKTVLVSEKDAPTQADHKIPSMADLSDLLQRELPA